MAKKASKRKKKAKKRNKQILKQMQDKKGTLQTEITKTAEEASNVVEEQLKSFTPTENQTTNVFKEYNKYNNSSSNFHMQKTKIEPVSVMAKNAPNLMDFKIAQGTYTLDNIYKDVITGNVTDRLPDDFMTVYSRASREQQSKFRTKVLSNHANFKDIDYSKPVGLNIENYFENKRILEQINIVEPFESSNILSSEIKKRKEIYQSQNENLMKNIKNSLGSTVERKTDDVISRTFTPNYEGIGEFYKELKAAATPMADGTVRYSAETINTMEQILKDTATNLDFTNDENAKKFLKKNYRAKTKEQTEEYIKGVKQVFDLDSSSVDALKSQIEKHGDKMRKQGKTVEALDKTFNKVGNAFSPRHHYEKAVMKDAKKQVKKYNKQVNKTLLQKMKETGAADETFTNVLKGHKGMTLGLGLNALFALGDYRESRKEGKTVLGSALKAGTSLAMGELLSFPGMLALGAAKGIGSLGVKGVTFAAQTSRSMNNLQQFTPFSGANFVDTQQLATMRQSGMELAKMSQYNLQQTLMGTEARNLHR